ncbi:hypothetical protein [Edwardsiella ictaluri]|uniref:GIY-YIG domain-containing protein n=1 Tax=Edwardsiella ictaluri TaxID=67780 RepID=A0ABY8GI55_EDWIC|nr:hypothetical protein [Edwardsiella ictaluri]ARD39181.1 hypothetical protein B6E78_07115 [Edwardsiella ictaluri]QPW27612.1 hypothetical protein F8538_13035 [Edwardsiella ictaluri]WFN97035.1 hypothetical protein MAY91_02595 [Edwardsiella ictaluri]
MKKIHIQWNGPYSLEQIKNMNSGKDYGLYQAYGVHTVYGSNVLLYIGQATYQTFGVRIPQHAKWGYVQDENELKFYVGRFAGNEEVSDKEWSEQISVAEKLLIFTHSPALNSSNINTVSNDIPLETHVYNWGNRRNLLPEVSAFRYLYNDNIHFPTYKTFGQDECE